MAKFAPTAEQLSAIGNRGGGLLVSAAAGSGKTRVLTERLMSYVADPDSLCDIDEFLIITYTRAAAAELRGRILEELSQRIAADPGNRRLRRQSALVYNAKISTIHGFCTGILRENAHLLGISPDFRVMEEAESDIIKNGVLDDLLLEKYESISQDKGFAALVDTMGAGRDDSRLCEITLDTHNSLQSHPYIHKWIEKTLAEMDFSGISDMGETIWGRVLMDSAHEAVRYWIREMEAALVDVQGDEKLNLAYGDSWQGTIDSLKLFYAALETGWDTACERADIDFPRPAKSIGGFDEIKAVRTRCKDEMKKLSQAFEYDTAELLEDMEAVRPINTALFELVLAFDSAYAAEKKRRGALDFSDLEHMAVELLVDSETMEPTELAVQISERFTEIMVDEYQDVNAVQDLIFTSVSKAGENIFMVGDVKQSIYRFRLADPSIFLKKYRDFKHAEEAGDGEPRKIILSKNFRSREGVLEAVNYVFKNIMSTSFGEMDYTESEYLYTGAEYPEYEEPCLEIDVVDLKNVQADEDEEGPNRAEEEARFVADRIEELVSGDLQVSNGKGGLRPVRCSDIVVLLRATKDKAGVYASALREKGIPASLEKGGEFWESLEISVITSMLSIIDNPRQDIPLISALRSPLYGFTADELAFIRAADKEADFFDALTAFSEANEKGKAFLTELEGYRFAAADMPADRLIWHIYAQTGALTIFGAMRGGSEKRANLMLLFEYARQFETAGYKGLFSFVTYLRKLMDADKNPPAADGPAAAGDAVRIMSIHKSKGLEFPVVILADTAKQFNYGDSKKPLLIHSELGAGPKRLDTARGIEYPTIARLAIAEKLKSEMLAEELRVLYVAMTRAKEKLIITCSYKDAKKETSRIALNVKTPVPPQVLKGARSMAEWILLTGPEVRDGGQEASDDKAEDESLIIESGDPVDEYSEDEIESELELIREKLTFTYPHEPAVSLPSKLTATELKGRALDYEAAEEAGETGAASTPQKTAFKRPRFVSEKSGLTTAERGTALHLVMQYINYDKCGGVDEIIGEIDGLVSRKMISPEQAAAVFPEKIYAFFRSELGRRVRSSKDLMREFKFSLLVPAEKYFTGGEGESVLLQGVVDCCLEEDGELTIIDFKTDYVDQNNLKEKLAAYKGQLDAYAYALEKITGKPTSKKLLYFFHIDEAIEV